MPLEAALSMIDRLARDGGEVALSFEGRGDPLLHPSWRQIVRHAVAAGFGAVHVRTDLAGNQREVDDLLALAIKAGQHDDREQDRWRRGLRSARCPALRA